MFDKGDKNRKPRNKYVPLWSIIISQRRQEHNVVKTVSSINGVGKIGHVHAKK